MLILECIKKKKGAGAQEARMGYCPFVRPRSRQAVSCCDKECKTGARPGLYVHNRTARAVGLAHNSAARATETLGSVSRQGWGWDWAIKVATGPFGH